MIKPDNNEIINIKALLKSLMVIAVLIGTCAWVVNVYGLISYIDNMSDTNIMLMTAIFTLALLVPILLFNVGGCREVFRYSDLTAARLKNNLLLLIPLCFIPFTYLAKEIAGNDFPSCNECSLGIGAILLLLVNVVILGPLFEEIVFRQILPKLLIGNLRVPSLITAIICSAGFSYIHLEGFSFYFFIFYFSSGLCFHYIRFKSGSLFIVFLAHSLYNLSITVLADVLGIL